MSMRAILAGVLAFGVAVAMVACSGTDGGSAAASQQMAACAGCKMECPKDKLCPKDSKCAKCDACAKPAK
jgi:hypothetical protein